MKDFEKDFIHIDEIFPFYEWLIPINSDNEKIKFFNTESYNPIFEYNVDKSRLNEIESKLHEITIPDIPVGKLYNRLKKEYLKKCELIRNIGHPDVFTQLSEELYGTLSNEALDFTNHILALPPEDSFSETVTPEIIKRSLENEIGTRGIKNWDIEIVKNIAAKVTVKPSINKVYIKADLMFFPNEAERLKTHEIAVHLLRAENGNNQDYIIFKRGLAGYLETEEGLAVYYENKRGVCDLRQMKVYAGRLKAVELTKNLSFVEAFDTLNEWFPRDISYRLCARVKRGITDTSCAGALTKDMHYISGYLKAKKLLYEHDFTNELFCGKTGFDDINEIRALLDSGDINLPLYKP
jgi:uncharacterized protein (TIGR02421 family)